MRGSQGLAAPYKERNTENGPRQKRGSCGLSFSLEEKIVHEIVQERRNPVEFC